MIVVCASAFGLAGYAIYKTPGFQANLKELKENRVMMDFEQLVLETYPSRYVDAMVQENHVLVVTLLYPGFLKESPALQGGKAREIASFCKQSYPMMAGIDYIEVRLVKELPKPRQKPSETFSYGFWANDLEAAPSAAAGIAAVSETQPVSSPEAPVHWEGIPLIPGAYEVNVCEAMICRFTVDQTMEGVKRYYIKTMQETGWEYRSGTNDRSMVFEKYERVVSIEVERQDRSWEKTRVHIFILP